MTKIKNISDILGKLRPGILPEPYYASLTGCRKPWTIGCSVQYQLSLILADNPNLYPSILRPTSSISFNGKLIKTFSVRVGILSCNCVSDIWFLISAFEVLMPIILPCWISLFTICDAMIPIPTWCWIAEIIAWWLSTVSTDWRCIFDFLKWCLNQDFIICASCR